MIEKHSEKSGGLLPPPLFLEGIPIHPFTVRSLHDYLGAVIDDGSRALVLHVNVHAMNLARRHPDFRTLFREADAVFCDGEGIRLGAWLLGGRVPPKRITYADWMWQLAAWGAARGYSFYFLGAEEGVASRAADRLEERVGNLKIAGVTDGYFRRRGIPDDQVVEKINSSGADILLVGMGMPLQERWLSENWGLLDTSIGLTAGGCFDWISGDAERCPTWMARTGLEWLYRFGREPVRLFGRVVVGLPWFIARTGLERARRVVGV